MSDNLHYADKTALTSSLNGEGSIFPLLGIALIIFGCVMVFKDPYIALAISPAFFGVYAVVAAVFFIVFAIRGSL